MKHHQHLHQTVPAKPAGNSPRRLPTALIALLAVALCNGLPRTTHAAPMDSDGEAIPDEIEQQFLEKYPPWLYYDGHDVLGCSATWFVQHSTLIKQSWR